MKVWSNIGLKVAERGGGDMRKDGCLSLSIAMLVFFLVMAVSYYGLAFMTLPLFRGSKGFLHKSLKFISARITILLGHLSDTTLSTPFVAGDLAAEWAIVLPTLFLRRTPKKKEEEEEFRNEGSNITKLEVHQRICFPVSMHCCNDI